MIHYFDSHAHLTDPDLFPEIEAILARALASGVTSMLNICQAPEELASGLLLAQSHPAVFNAAATHPHNAATDGERDFAAFEDAASKEHIVAIGETGLDYHYDHSPKETQQSLLTRYLALAASTQLPIIFHCREAFADLFALTDAHLPKAHPAVLHCFTGTPAEAEQVLQRGWYLSLSGIVTFNKSDELRAIAKLAPLSQLLIETDAPYLAPQTHRGKRNEPSFLPETAHCIARSKGISIEEVARATRDNALKLFT